MNWFDFLLLAIAVFYVIGGLIRGALRQLFGLFGFFAVVGLSYLGTPYLSGLLTGLLQSLIGANPGGEPAAAFSLPEQLIGLEGALPKPGQLLPEQLTRLAASVAVFLVLLLLLAALFRLLMRALTMVNKIPVIGPFNRLGGALLGLLTALLLSFMLINLAAILPVPAVGEAVKSSQIAGGMKAGLPQLMTAFEERVIDHFLRYPVGGGA